MHLSKFGIFKTRSPKGFEFTPRYYSERKERIEKLEDKFRAELQRADGDASRLKDQMSAQWGSDHVSRQNGFARKRLLIILVVLGLALVYMYFKLDTSF